MLTECPQRCLFLYKPFYAITQHVATQQFAEVKKPFAAPGTDQDLVKFSITLDKRSRISASNLGFSAGQILFHLIHAAHPADHQRYLRDAPEPLQ